MFCYLRIAGTVPVLSDGAANALQARDMLHGNLLLHGWWVTDVSFLTTELPQYALVIAAAGLRPEVVHICAAITYTLLVLLAAYVARGRATGAEAVVRALIAAGDHARARARGTQLGAAERPRPRRHRGAAAAAPAAARPGPGLPVGAGRGLRPARVGSVGDPLAEVVGALPLAVVCLARVAMLRPRRLERRMRTYWYEVSLAAAALLAVLAAKAVDELIPALGGYQINKGVSGIIPLGESPATGRWCCAACWRCSGPTSRTRQRAPARRSTSRSRPCTWPGWRSWSRRSWRPPGGWSGRWCGWAEPAPADGRTPVRGRPGRAGAG